MVQIDVFMAYGLSSGLALAAKAHLQNDEHPHRSKYFLTTVLLMSCAFVPQLMYLTWASPAWETMFVATSFADIPPWFVWLLCVLIVIAGSAGFLITSMFLRAARFKAAWAQAAVSIGAALWICTVGWDGTGYERMLYAGTGEDWANGVTYPILDFLTSPVGIAMPFLQAPLMVPFVYFVVTWARKRAPELQATR